MMNAHILSDTAILDRVGFRNTAQTFIFKFPFCKFNSRSAEETPHSSLYIT